MALTISINQAAAFTVNVGVPGPTGPTGPAGPAGPAGPTFTGGPITSPITYTVGDTVSVFENGDFYVEHNGSGAYGVVYINGLEASDGTNTILVQASGITFGDLTVQNTAFPGFAGYALESWVSDGFYPLTGNPSGFLTSSALTGYATESFVTSQGYIGDAPSDGSQYARQDGAWAIVSGGGGSYLPLAGGSMDADATIALEDTVIGTVSEVGGYGFAVSSAADPNSLTNVLFDRVLVKNESYQTTLTPTGIEFPDATFQTTAFNGSYLPLAGGTMTGAIVFDGTSGQYINKGNFDSGRGGNFGISLVCSIGYEFNWQAGWLTTTNQGSTTPRPLYLDSLAGTTLRSWDSATDTGVEVAHTGITFSDTSVQSTAFPGFTGYATETFVTSQGFITDAALTPYLTSADAATTYQTLSGMSSYLTTSSAASTYQTLSGMSSYLTTSSAASTYQTLSGMSSYLTTSAAASTYAITSRGLPASGTAGQVLTKVDGTDYNATWTTFTPGDRYLTTSSTSNAVSNGNKTFTIGTGLSYTPTQNITISYDASHHMHGEVLTYNSGTGVLTVDVNNHTGTGTYASWVVNVGGVTPATSVAWGDITGTLGDQSDLANALNAKLELSGGTMTGGVAIVVPSGGPSYGNASYYYGGVSGNSNDYGVTSSWGLSGSTGLAWNDGTVSGAFNSSGITFPDATVQATAGISAGDVSSTYYPLSNPYGFIGDATSDSTLYARFNGSWSPFAPGIGDATSDGQIYGRQSNAWTVIAGKPSSSEAVWIYGGWQSASIKNVFDMGSYSYYNVLTF